MRGFSIRARQRRKRRSTRAKRNGSGGDCHDDKSIRRHSGDAFHVWDLLPSGRSDPRCVWRVPDRGVLRVMTTAKEIMQFILCLVILAAITWPLWGLGKM